MINIRLRNAVIAGTAALLWSVPSLNIFGVIGTVMSWAAYSSQKRESAATAAVMYIIALVVSVFTGVCLMLVKNSKVFMPIAEILTFMAAFSLVGDLLYIIAAAMSFKGVRLMKESDTGSGSFFD